MNIIPNYQNAGMPLLNIPDKEPIDFVRDPRFKKVLFLASPDVARMTYDQQILVKGNLVITLSQHFNRMCSQYTPFGFFAGCAVAIWGGWATCKSTQEYIQLKKMDVAKEKIFDTSKSVSEIAYELGFKYSQHFTRSFKQHTGSTPNGYRMLN